MTVLSTEAQMDVLLAVLGDDVQHLQIVLQQLDRLRSLLIKRDDAGLEQLLAEMRHQTEVHAAHEQRRQGLRKELADRLQCEVAQVTLTRLAQSRSGPQRNDIMECQATLRSLIGRLKRELTLTSMLVADCARFNRSLLQLFFQQNGRGKISYGAKGTPIRRADATLVSLRF